MRSTRNQFFQNVSVFELRQFVHKKWKLRPFAAVALYFANVVVAAASVVATAVVTATVATTVATVSTTASTTAGVTDVATVVVIVLKT